MSFIHRLLGYGLLGITMTGFLWHIVRAWTNRAVQRWEVRWPRWLLTGLYGQLLLGALLFLLTGAEHMPSPLHPILGIGVIVLAQVGLPSRGSTAREFHLRRAGFLALLGLGLWITSLHF